MIEDHESHKVNRNNGSSLPSSKLIVVFLGLVVLCGLSFYGGVAYQKGKKIGVTTASTSSLRNSQFGPGNRMNGARPISGEVTTVSATGITINNTFTGAATTFSVTSSTKISNNDQTATINDIKSGDTVAIIAATGSTTEASQILINPSFGRGGAAPQADTMPSGDTNLSTQ